MTTRRFLDNTETLPVHPLTRLIREAPEQLEPALRRAAWRMVRRRLGRWLARRLSDLAILITDSRRGAAVS